MIRNLLKCGLANSRRIAPRTYQISVRKNFSTEFTNSWPVSIKTFLDKNKIEKPTDIQAKTIPIVMQEKDLVGVARTGSGKTLAFVIPAVMKILKEKEEQNNQVLPTCLVLSPTRELAQQTSEVFDKFSYLGVKSIPLFGGKSRDQQLYQLREKAYDALIATPGRLLDLESSGDVDLSNIKYLVLDEADRMLDMGFEPQMREIIKKLPSSRQTLMWSATWPEEIKDLAEQFMKDYEYIAVDSEKLKATPNVKQIIRVCDRRSKLNELLKCYEDIKDHCPNRKILIFVRTKMIADKLSMRLLRERIDVVTLHGNKTQLQRDNAIARFKGRAEMMIATDVASRGLDIQNITHVINFEFPDCINSYIHRIGRTGRHDKTGTAISLFTEEDSSMARKLVQVLKESNQEIPDELKAMATSSRSNLGIEDIYESRPRRHQGQYGRQHRYSSTRY